MLLRRVFVLLFASAMMIGVSHAQTPAPQPGGVAPAVEAPPPPAVQPPEPIVSPDLASPAVSFDTLPHDLSPWGMYLAADWVVKAVMISLAIASVLTWTVWLAKSIELSGAKRRARRSLSYLSSLRSLSAVAGRPTQIRGAVARLFDAAQLELDRSSDCFDKEGIKERVISRLDRIEASAARSIARGTGVLATIGATAPFIGLFGTVWGIMNSFIGISKAQTTNLAVVAPGIAEALLATAMGLIAAIPAVIIYNVFVRSIAGYRGVLGDASAELQRLVSRDLDHLEGANAKSLKAISE